MMRIQSLFNEFLPLRYMGNALGRGSRSVYPSASVI